MYTISDSLYRRRRALGYTHDETLAYPATVRYKAKDQAIYLDDNTFYPTRKVLADQHQIPYATLRMRLKNGASYEDAILPVVLEKRAREIIVGGVPYPSQGAAARAHGIHAMTFSNRLSQGFSPDQAAGLKPPPVRPNYVVDGVPYTYLTDLADAYAVKVETLSQRLAQNWTLEQAVGLADTPSAITVEGQTYAFVADIADAYGVTRQALNHRLSRTNDLLIALGLAPAAGITRDHPAYRLRRSYGFTHHEALRFPAHIKATRPVRLFGVTFPNISTAKRACLYDDDLFTSVQTQYDHPATHTCCTWFQYQWQTVDTRDKTRHEPVIVNGRRERHVLTLEGFDYLDETTVAYAYGLTKQALDKRLQYQSLDVAVGITPGEKIDAHHPRYNERRGVGFTHDEACAFPSDIEATHPVRLFGVTFPNRQTVQEACNYGGQAFLQLIHQGRLEKPTDHPVCIWRYMRWHARRM